MIVMVMMSEVCFYIAAREGKHKIDFDNDKDAFRIKKGLGWTLLIGVYPLLVGIVLIASQNYISFIVFGAF